METEETVNEEENTPVVDDDITDVEDEEGQYDPVVVAGLQEDSRILEDILSDPDIQEVIARKSGGSQTKQTQQNIDPNIDPMGALRAGIRDVIQEEIRTALTPIQTALYPLLTDREANLRYQNYESVITRFPKAQDVGFDKVQQIMEKYPNMTAKEAVTLLKPSAFATRTVKEPPITPSKPSSKTGGDTGIDASRQKSLLEQSMETKESIRDIASRVYNTLRNKR